MPVNQFLCALCLAFVPLTGQIASQGPSKDVPELAVLDHWVGKVESKRATPTAATGRSEAVWILDGRFVRQDWTIDAVGDEPRFSGSTLMTYDSEKKCYKSWSFQSNGTILESEGDWDEAKRTLTWVSKPLVDGVTVHTVARFHPDKTEQWTIVVKSRDGETIYESTGENTPPRR